MTNGTIPAPPAWFRFCVPRSCNRVSHRKIEICQCDSERSDLGSPFGRAGCPVRGSLRGSHVPIGAAQPSNGVPSQSACSADSSPKGRAKGAVSASAINSSFEVLHPAAMAGQKICPPKPASGGVVKWGLSIRGKCGKIEDKSKLSEEFCHGMAGDHAEHRIA